MKWIGLAAGILLIVSCFTPWVVIEERGITVSGIDTTGTGFGKPGYLHIVMAVLFIVFSLVQRIWAKRFNLVFTALNLGWAIRNYFIISACHAGDCPAKKSGLFIMLFASVLMLVASLFPDMELPQDKGKPSR